MTYQETHQRYLALREIEAAAARNPDGTLPWKAEYAGLFGSRDGLLQALRHRWDLMTQAQLDPELDERLLDELALRLRHRNRGLLAILNRAEHGMLPAAG